MLVEKVRDYVVSILSNSSLDIDCVQLQMMSIVPDMNDEILEKYHTHRVQKFWQYTSESYLSSNKGGGVSLRANIYC